MSPDPRLVRLIMDLRRAGIADARVLSAMERAPRAAFVEPAFADLAYADRPLPIGEESVPSPYVAAAMAEALEVDERAKVFEVGAGSGYQAAILALLARRVHAMDRRLSLVEGAKARLAAMGIDTVTLRHGDGLEGWFEQAPFHRILVSASCAERPDRLIGELAMDGVLVAPVGPPDGQVLTRYRRTAAGVSEEPLIEVRFAPLVSGVDR